jgi:hypothetical protein
MIRIANPSAVAGLCISSTSTECTVTVLDAEIEIDDAEDCWIGVQEKKKSVPIDYQSKKLIKNEILD